MAKQRAKIEGWELVKINGNPALVGHITEHPRQVEFKEQLQLTSDLLRIDFVQMEAETQNTIYQLL